MLFRGNKLYCLATLYYLFYVLKYSCKVLVDRKASSLYVTTKISPGAQTVFSEEHRERLQSLQHLLKAQEGHHNVSQPGCCDKC